VYISIIVSLLFNVLGCSLEVPVYNYNIKNQTLQGKIEGETWVFKSGSGEEDFSDPLYLDFDLYDIDSDYPCDWSSYSSQDYASKVIFNMPATVGLRELKFSFSNSEENQTVTLYTLEDNFNNIATQGVVEILSITDTEINAQMDIYIDENNFLNGKFTVPYCE